MAQLRRVACEPAFFAQAWSPLIPSDTRPVGQMDPTPQRKRRAARHRATRSRQRATAVSRY